MADLDKLIKTILADTKFAAGGAAAKVYRDEPILLTARQLEQLTPPRYRAMRKLAGRHESEAAIFYKQGKFMEDFEDQFDFQGSFTRYFPTYQVMSDQELRGYFSWRTRLRRGRLEKTHLSFVFVHVYELLNQIGVNSPEEGFFALKKFWLAYRELDVHLDRYVTRWLRDYVVYHNLDKSLLEEFDDIHFDQALLVLLDAKARRAEEVFAALNSLSSYNLMKSKFVQERLAEFHEVVSEVFALFSAHYEKNCRSALFEKFFGKVYAHVHIMFSSAVFYQPQTPENRVYEINPICKFICRDGRWQCERFFVRKANREVGGLLKTIDFLMRQKHGFKSSLKIGRTTKLLTAIINTAIDNFQAKRARAARGVVEIDVSRLQSIREAALETQGKLLVDEAESAAAEDILGRAAGPENGERSTDGKLDETERGFLACLFQGRDYDGLLRSKGLMLSLLIDSINEKLFEDIGDTVIVETNGRPELIEDYLEEVKALIWPT